MFEEKLLEPHFTSVLAPYMLDVVEQKRALGNKYNAYLLYTSPSARD